MDHGLFVACQIIGEVVAVLEERLSETGHVAVTEDPKATREESTLLVVALDRLHAQESHQRLGHGESHRTARHDVIGSRGSTTCVLHDPRTQSWVGSSQKAIVRSGAGPASTFKKYRS